MMKTTFTIAGNLALVSLFGLANAGYSQTAKSDAPAKPAQQATSIVVKASAAKDGTFDVVIIENGKTRKVTGLKPGPKGLIELPSGPNGEATLVLDPAAGPLTDVILKAEGKPLIFPSGAAAAQAQTRDVSVKATSNGSGTFDVEITENGKTRKLTGVKSNPDGTLDIPELKDIAAVGTTISKQNKVIRVEGKPLILPSGAAAAQAHSSNVSVKAIGNGSGTFDVEITENGKTRKLTGLKPGPKGKIEVPSGVAGHPPIVIDTTEGPTGNVSVRVEGKPLILPSGAAAAQAQAQSQSISVQATTNSSGTFDVEITENGKTRKLTGVKAKADGSLDISELNGDAPKGAKVEKQIKIITSDSSNAGIALPDTANRVEIDASDIVIDAQGLPLSDIASGTTVTVTASAAGKAPTIVKTGRVVAGKSAGAKIVSGIGSADGQKVILMDARPNAAKASKEVLIEAKLVNGKKVVSAPKLVVLSGQTAKIQAGDVWLSLRATISPAGTISVKGDAGSAKSPKGPGFSVSGLASGGSFNYPNGNAGTWEIKASVSRVSASKPGGQMFIFKAAKP
jgi:hypothetical protein